MIEPRCSDSSEYFMSRRPQWGAWPRASASLNYGRSRRAEDLGAELESPHLTEPGCVRHIGR